MYIVGTYETTDDFHIVLWVGRMEPHVGYLKKKKVNSIVGFYSGPEREFHLLAKVEIMPQVR